VKALIPDPLCVKMHRPMIYGLEVWLNGKREQFVFAASISGGWIEQYVPGENGTPRLNANRTEMETRRVYGVVEIRRVGSAQ